MDGGERRKHRRRSRSRSRSPKRKHKHRSRSRSRSPHERRRSRSRSPNSSLDGTRQREKKHAAKNDRKKEKKKEKELLKAMETPEEKRARRLAKKEAKDRKKRQESGWDEENLGYTNTDNPFGDAHLLEAFVWHKKREKEGNKRVSEEEHRRKERMRQEETRGELEKVRKRRQEREHEMLMREEERERLQREKEAEYYKEWEEQEDTFHLEQAKLRSKIRIKDGRAKPIDLLAKYINGEEEDLDIQMHEPYTILVGLTKRDLEDLLEDIKVYMELEQSKNTEFWKDITIVCKDELRKLRKSDSRSERVVDRRESINTSVHDDVAKVFKGKTYSQLIALEKQIHQKITSGDAVDIGYWESLLVQIKAYMSKARLREKHQTMLKDKLMQLKQQKSEFLRYSSEESSESEAEPEPSTSLEKDDKHTTARYSEGEEEPRPENMKEDVEGLPEKSGEDDDEKSQVTNDNTGVPQPQPTQSVYSEEDLMEEGYAAYEDGSYSPKLIKISDVVEAHIRDPAEDWEQLEILRHNVLSGGGITTAIQRFEGSSEAAGMYQKEANRGMQPDEEAFNVPVPLTQKAYLWQDKYRPRKPRFFNRVHTGYEWNKYNQTHYDSDNPPPKIVQGYKFNIFYPDLIDKTQAPEYFLEPCKDNKEFGILRFHAGPPYEDIAFKIVNREWEYSHRHGFRCQFQNNNFQLWFHFKRYRYRR